jgi:hypothetical protein
VQEPDPKFSGDGNQKVDHESQRALLRIAALISIRHRVSSRFICDEPRRLKTTKMVRTNDRFGNTSTAVSALEGRTHGTASDHYDHADIQGEKAYINDGLELLYYPVISTDL